MSLEDRMPRRPATDPKPPPITIWERYRWDAKDAFVRQELEKPVKCIHFTHTGTEECSTPQECTRIVRELQQAHMAKGMPDIQYNWLVGGGGHVFEGRGWDVQPSVFQDDVKEFHGSVLCIAYIGTFTDKYPPEELMHTSGLLLFEAMEKKIYLPDVMFMPLKLQPKKPKDNKGENPEKANEGGDKSKVEQPEKNSNQKTAYEAGTPDYRVFLNDPIGQK